MKKTICHILPLSFLAALCVGHACKADGIEDIKNWLEETVAIKDSLGDPVVLQRLNPHSGGEAVYGFNNNSVSSWDAAVRLPKVANGKTYLTASGSANIWRFNSGLKSDMEKNQNLGLCYITSPSDSELFFNISLGKEWVEPSYSIKLSGEALVPALEDGIEPIHAGKAEFEFKPPEWDGLAASIHADFSTAAEIGRRHLRYGLAPFGRLILTVTYHF